MKLLSWNCQMAYRKKQHLIEEFQPDIAIIQECEHTDKIESEKIYQKLWVGDNEHKGVGIFSYNPAISMELIPFPEQNNRWFIPVKLSNGMSIMAVWAMYHRGNEVIDNIQPSYRTINAHQALIGEMDCILGDFNDNVIWDKKSKKAFNNSNFAELLALLNSLGFNSVYHELYAEAPGEETRPTHIWRKSYETTYHIDYVFLRNTLFDRVQKYELLDQESWIKVSDHFPMLIELAL